MIKFNSMLTIAVLATALFAIQSCNNGKKHHESEHHSEAHHDMDKSEMSSNYACPMHPEITGEKGDKCSKYGMKLDKKENSEHSGKEYTSAYICPMHCEGSGSDEAGKCPV